MTFDVTCQEKYRTDTPNKGDPLTNRLLTSAHESHMVRADYHASNGTAWYGMTAIISAAVRANTCCWRQALTGKVSLMLLFDISEGVRKFYG